MINLNLAVGQAYSILIKSQVKEVAALLESIGSTYLAFIYIQDKKPHRVRLDKKSIENGDYVLTRLK